MSCHDARESLSAFLDEALAPDERQRVAQHLEGSGLAGAQPVKEARRVACLHLSHGKTIPRAGSSRVEMPTVAPREGPRIGVVDSAPS